MIPTRPSSRARRISAAVSTFSKSPLCRATRASHTAISRTVCSNGSIGPAT